MKKFNLEDALNGKPVITRDGRNVRIAGYNPDREDKDNCIITWVKDHVLSFYKDGSHFKDEEHNADLFMMENEEWVIRIVQGNGTTSYIGPFQTRNQAQLYPLGWVNENAERSFHKIILE
jgi:hypothetical protein